MKKLIFGVIAVMMLLVLFAGCQSAPQEDIVVIDPTDPPAAGAETPDEPAATPEAQPSTEPDEPADQPAEPSAEPDEPADQPAGPVDKAFFDDAAFVGDSVSLKLSYYNKATKALSNAQFFTAGSLGSANALWEVSDESVHPSYQGEKMLIEDCVAKSGVKKVFVMLGMNDIGLYGTEDSVVNYEKLMDNILAKSPDVEIYVQSMTPMTSTSNIIGKRLNNENIVKYNANLKALAESRGWHYVDVYSVMVQEDGSLIPEYCSDPNEMGVHFTEEGCKVWVDYLLNNVQ